MMPVGHSPHDFMARQAALWRGLPDPDVAAILVFGFGDAMGAGTASHGGMRYLTGWNSHEAQSLAILTHGHCTLLIGSPFLDPSLAVPPAVSDTKSIPPSGWGAAITAQLGPTPRLATIGFDEMPRGVWNMLDPADFVPLDTIFAQQRMIKTDPELDAMRAGAALCDDLFDRLPGMLRGGDPVWKLQLQLETHARLSGADYCRTWLTCRSQADRPRYWPEENRNTPCDGDQVLFGIALTVDGYWAHGIRMGSIGPARPEHQILWDIVEDAFIAGQIALRPGAMVCDAERAMAEVIDHAAAHWPIVYQFRRGHGLGLSYEEPLLSDQFPQHWGPDAFRTPPPPPIPVTTGMVLELHPNLFVPGLGGAALGEMLAITSKQAEPLLRCPRRLFLT